MPPPGRSDRRASSGSLWLSDKPKLLLEICHLQSFPKSQGRCIAVSLSPHVPSGMVASGQALVPWCSPSDMSAGLFGHE